MNPLTTLAWRPFLDPVNIHDLWFLLLPPLVLGISLAYKAVRVGDLKDLPRQVLVMTVQGTLGMIALGAAAYAFVNHILPLIAPK